MFGQVKIANTKEISEKIFYKVKLNCIFRIVSFILERSKMEKEMDKEGIIIKMVTNFKVSGKMILNQQVVINFRMEINFKVDSKRIN